MKKKIAILLVTILIIGGFFAYQFYSKIYHNNVIKTAYIYIPAKADFNKIQELLNPFLKNKNSFVWVAQKKNYQNKIRSGKFMITEGMSNNELVDHLRGGEAETVKLMFNNQDTFEKLSGRIAIQIEADSVSILRVLQDDDFLKKNHFNSSTALAMYIPNTYELYWDTSAEQFRERMLKEYHSFWNDERLENAKKQNLTPLEVSILASIVQKETALVIERPTVAGLYLNRHHDNWPLQADPTIIYALKQKHGQDAVFKRVLYKDLSIDSPYNTYQNIGLPPGPISMPDISSIDAVLVPKAHSYYYMCASVSQIGKHEFAKSLKQHNINARKYQNWLNKQGINR